MESTNPTHHQPIVTVDIVLLTLRASDVDHETRLHLALVKRKQEPFAGVWSLPGGWIHTDEDGDDLDAAKRILSEKMGVQSPYLEQLRTFASKTRDARGWSVSIVYYALVPSDSLQESDEWKWQDVQSVHHLPFDHLSMLEAALSRLRSKSIYSSLPVYLMPAQFSMSELQRVYEIILGEPLDKRGFGRRIEEMDILEEVPAHRVEKTDVKNGRPAAKYWLKKQAQKHLQYLSRTLNSKS